MKTSIRNHGGGIPSRYVHHQREVQPGEPLALERGVLKWYEVFRRGEEPAGDLDATARAAVTDIVRSESFPLQYGVGFVILHHSTASDYLIACCWHQIQELWHAILVRPADGSADFRQEWPSQTSASFCVWEMAPMWHERNAWERYLNSSRDDDAMRAYLTDQLTGST
ncbi:MAG: hypothetical protein AVDCRST_MAG87-948 [uncultured Thermomicrobiales bacterium]|uniref:Uncharacterized protein n=1 Tax=uncultured Thermomicrobiales bacterium TaxID=1645740 RepID=A0A6J4UIZ6_9BACT|nr:MAG: hypothetical protein AVDCRST_MAG87-948 [uncultured Thermomicrobiales bacterium]